MTVRGQTIDSRPDPELSFLEAKADRRRKRVRAMIVDAREQEIEKRKDSAPKPKQGLLARINRGE